MNRNITWVLWESFFVLVFFIFTSTIHTLKRFVWVATIWYNHRPERWAALMYDEIVLPWPKRSSTCLFLNATCLFILRGMGFLRSFSTPAILAGCSPITKCAIVIDRNMLTYAASSATHPTSESPTRWVGRSVVVRDFKSCFQQHIFVVWTTRCLTHIKRELRWVPGPQDARMSWNPPPDV